MNTSTQLPSALKSVSSIDGKKLKKSHVNLLAKLADKYGVTLGTESGTRRNPYSGVSATLCPLALALYDFIINNYCAGLVYGSTLESTRNPNAIPRTVWDAARYLFLEYWPDEFYSLID